MKLVIVESPTKAKTISQFLGPEYTVQASMGHVRDLPVSKMGVDVEHDFLPSYVTPTKAKKTLTSLKKLAASADTILLATDEDREGEAIAWHLSQAIGLNAKQILNLKSQTLNKSKIPNSKQIQKTTNYPATAGPRLGGGKLPTTNYPALPRRRQFWHVSK